MATNLAYDPGTRLALPASHPANPQSGQPCRFGTMTGVALTDERAGGDVSIDFGHKVWDLPVKGVNDGGNSAVAVGAAVYYVDGDVGDGSGFLSKKVSGIFFGYTLAAVDSGATATVQVLHVPSPGPGTGDALTPGSVDTAELADGAVTGPKLGEGLIYARSADGKDETDGPDLAYTVSGVDADDEVVAVLFLSTKASVATVAVLDADDWEVTGADTITADSAVDRSDDQLVFFLVSHA